MNWWLPSGGGWEVSVDDWFGAIVIFWTKGGGGWNELVFRFLENASEWSSAAEPSVASVALMAMPLCRGRRFDCLNTRQSFAHKAHRRKLIYCRKLIYYTWCGYKTQNSDFQKLPQPKMEQSSCKHWSALSGENGWLALDACWLWCSCGWFRTKCAGWIRSPVYMLTGMESSSIAWRQSGPSKVNSTMLQYRLSHSS